MTSVEVEVRLRERNQLTLPDRIVERTGLAPGDQMVAAFDEAEPDVIRLRALPRSYKGAGGGAFGSDDTALTRYVAEERASWSVDQSDPGSATDGTRFLTLAESQRVYRLTDLTRQMYDARPFYRWPKCEFCGRFIARMNEHRKKHSGGLFTKIGVRTDEEQRRRSAIRVRKWKSAMAARARGR